MDISLITFHGFAYGGKTLFARQVHVEGVADSESRSGSRYVSVAERRARLDERVEESGVSELFGAVREMFRENWPVFRMRPGSLWTQYQASETGVCTHRCRRERGSSDRCFPACQGAVPR
jgi:hypothetical protein